MITCDEQSLVFRNVPNQYWKIWKDKELNVVLDHFLKVQISLIFSVDLKSACFAVTDTCLVRSTSRFSYFFKRNFLFRCPHTVLVLQNSFIGLFSYAVHDHFDHWIFSFSLLLFNFSLNRSHVYITSCFWSFPMICEKGQLQLSSISKEIKYL